MRYFCILFFFIISNAANAGTARDPYVKGLRVRTIADTDTAVKKRSIYAGVGYGTDVLFFGRTGPVKYPYFSTDVIYNAKSGVFLYGSAVKVLGYEPLVDEIDVAAGNVYKHPT